jgi:hypothetical protein
MRLDSEGFFEAKSLGLDIIERNWSVLTFLFFLVRARIFLRVYEASSDVLSQSELNPGPIPVAVVIPDLVLLRPPIHHHESLGVYPLLYR